MRVIQISRALNFSNLSTTQAVGFVSFEYSYFTLRLMTTRNRSNKPQPIRGTRKKNWLSITRAFETLETTPIISVERAVIVYELKRNRESKDCRLSSSQYQFGSALFKLRSVSKTKRLLQYFNNNVTTWPWQKNVRLQKMSIPLIWGFSEILKSLGVSKTKVFQGKFDDKLEFCIMNSIPPMTF